MAELDWVDLASSNMEAAAFDAETNEVLIRFQSGAEYAYSGTEDDLHRLMADPSAAKGHYFDRQIKPRSYRRVS